ncbi:MAG: discoidin domain-containing protein, partial [Burkholderiales bacterium]|nr:discoidin domain-containing protein [Burkholderiales bacterium]
WSSTFVDPSWIEVDLGSAQTFNRVVLFWQNAYGAAYQIQTSNDNANWTTVYTQTQGKGGIEDLSFPSTTARYVRLYGTQRATPYGYSLWEMEVYNTAAGSTPAVSFIEQPAAQTVPLGQTGHFAAEVAGTGPFTYQWLANGVAIAGATSQTYDTPPTTTASSGTVYTVAVTGPAGTVTSAGATLTVNSAIPNYTVTPGFINVNLVNGTNGAYPDSQVYVAVLARDPATNQFAWLQPNGTISQASVADNTAPGHLTAGGQNYSNYFFTLAQSKSLLLPQMYSGRIYVSLGSPLYIKILADANNNIGYAGPNPQNQTDPNNNIYFDWYEFTYNNAGLWINTTQVDEFGFPMLQDVYGSNHTFHQQTGITLPRATLLTEYAAETPKAFSGTPNTAYRIMAPAKSSFAAGQANGSYFDGYVAEVWNYYTSNVLTIKMNGRQFNGQVQANGQFQFTEVNLGNGAYVGGTYVVNKPTTQDVMTGAGALANGNPTELAIEAQICAAFNRHVMEDVTKWSTPSAWYQAAPANYYAKFFHDHSVSGLAYGFPYDDVSAQSSTIMAPKPEYMVLTIGF